MMKDLRPIKGRYYIRRLVAEGEHEQQDFKFAIADARKIARSISAFANNSGGRLLIGVKDNGAIAGMRSDEDIYLVEQAAEMYCRPPQHVEADAYTVEPGVVVAKITIARSQQRPVRVVEAGGRLRTYFRVADENIAVPWFVERAWRGCGRQGTLLAADGAEQRLTSMLESGEAPAFNEIVRRLHLTAESVEKVVARLYSLGIIDFVHKRDGFRIVLRPDNSENL